MRPDGSHCYYHSDALGSTRVVTDDAGNPVSAFNYDAYGAVRQSAGEGRTFAFTGEQLDTETSMVFLRARYYDPQTGRFVQRDTFDGRLGDPPTLNRYGYASGNPLRYSDPSGHLAIAPFLAAAAALLTVYDVGSSLNTMYLDPDANSEDRTEAAEHLGTYVTAYQAGGLMGEAGAVATVGSVRGAGKLLRAVASLLERGKVGALGRVAQECALTTSHELGAIQATQEIATRYGPAIQSRSVQALQPRSEVERGSTVYKGGSWARRSETTESQFWAMDDPLTTPDYAARYGLPEGNPSFDFVLAGRVKDGAAFITREAPGISSNTGEGIEVVVDPGSVFIDGWYMP